MKPSQRLTDQIQVITGSFVSMLDIPKGLWPGHTYDETDWNPITLEQALSDVSDGYAGRASKTASGGPKLPR